MLLHGVLLCLFAGFGVLQAMLYDQDRGQLEYVEHLVAQWAPLIWLAPEEQHFPSSVEEFLDHVFVSDENGKVLHESVYHQPFVSNFSSSTYLVTRRSLDSLKRNEDSVLRGRSPKENSVPIYAIISLCTPFYSFSNSDSNSLWINLNTVYGQFSAKPFFHVTYWVFFPYNEGKPICFLGKVPAPRIFNTCFGKLKTMGNHVGDWEHMSLSFKGKPFPNRLYLSVHDVGAYYKYDEDRRIFRYDYRKPKATVQSPKYPPIVRTQFGHPVLFAAMGSHGLWSSPGDHDFVRVPRLTDKCGYGVPWKTWTNVISFHLGRSKLPAWITYAGKWGNPKSNCLLFKKLGICEYTDGPIGVLRPKPDFVC